VSEGVVGLVEPFVDTLVICTMTGLVVVLTGVWKERVPTEITLRGGDISYVAALESDRYVPMAPPPQIRVEDGFVRPSAPDQPRLAWHELAVARFFTDPEQTRPFTGTILPAEGLARPDDALAGSDARPAYTSLYADAAESAAPLTMIAFRKGLSPIGDFGHHIVLISVLLFAISTAISWSYYGDRCAHYLLGARAVLPYKILFVIAHFLGAVVSLSVAWTLGDVCLGIVILPNLLALILLSTQVRQLTDSYFARKPWLENAQVHRRIVEERERGPR
jgi:AGCS family alanine or glycine:cation symporter